MKFGYFLYINVFIAFSVKHVLFLFQIFKSIGSTIKLLNWNIKWDTNFCLYVSLMC